jgi:hypothetical protein
MASYADFAFYSTQYLGTAIAETSFPQLALRASATLDQITFGRVATDTTNTTAIKMAMCAIAEELQRQDTSGSLDGIASESQGQYSVSFFEHSQRAKSNQSKLENVAKLWLANTFLLFGGFNSDEYGSTADDS